jgi:DNA gyrase subunit A
VGSRGASTRDEDFVEHIFPATNHNWLLIFTAFGRCFWMRIYEVPEGSKASKGRAIQNLIQIEPGDKILTYIPVIDLKDEAYTQENYVVLATKQGLIKKTTLQAYARPRANGINAITIREGDELLSARLTNGDNEIILGLRSGKAIRFHESTARAVGRTAMGVKGVTLGHDKDEVIGMVCVRDASSDILVVSEQGYGKRSAVDDYRITNRGGKGVKTLNITEKTGDLISILNVTDDEDLMIINKSGITIRIAVDSLRVMGRATQGVRLIQLRNNDEIASVTRVPKSEEEEEITDGGEHGGVDVEGPSAESTNDAPSSEE